MALSLIQGTGGTLRTHERNRRLGPLAALMSVAIDLEYRVMWHLIQVGQDVKVQAIKDQLKVHLDENLRTINALRYRLSLWGPGPLVLVPEPGPISSYEADRLLERLLDVYERIMEMSDAMVEMAINDIADRRTSQFNVTKGTLLRCRIEEAKAVK